MATSLVDAESVLAIDVGAVNTRALLFDVVEGRYRFLAVGTAPTTAVAPYRNISEGARMALEQLEDLTGRVLLDDRGDVIKPSQADGSGVDHCAALLSAGAPLKAVLVGLLEDISVASGQSLLATGYTQVVDTVTLNDRRNASARLDGVLKMRPDLILVVGGTEGGASQSVLTLLESVGLACFLLPKEQRPEVMFAGNQELVDEIQASIGNLTSLHIAPNVRPSLDFEQLAPAQAHLLQVFRQARMRQLAGANDIDAWSGGRLAPAASAYGRTIRFISKQYTGTRKGVLGVDLGGSTTTIAAGLAGDLALTVLPNHGIGEGLSGLLSTCTVDDVLRWLPFEASEADVREYIQTKVCYPTSLPATPEDLAMEHALATQLLFVAMKRALRNMPVRSRRLLPNTLPWFEPIIASGSVLTHAPRQGQSLLVLLNGLQPVGITTIALDQNDLTASLGAAAEVSPLLTVQALDETNYPNLCTVITPVGYAAPGTPVLRIKMKRSDGNEAVMDVKYGSLEVFPIPNAKKVKLQLQPLHRFDIGMGGPGVGGGVDVPGSALGVVIDARGRPLTLPADSAQRIELNMKWAGILGNVP